MTGVQVRNGIVDIDVPTDEDAKQCARLLKDQQGPTFRSLDLRRGVVTSAGASVIAKGLKGNSSLRHLGLSGNSIGDAGVAAIGRSVEGNLGCALTSLDLSATGITVVGLSNLVQGVSTLPSLHTVCLNDNNLAQEAGLQLSNLLKASASLHTVQASGNYLGDRGLAALCGAFCYLNPARVLSLDVSGNGIGDLGAQWLCKGISALCRNENRSADPGAGGSSSKGGHRGGSGPSSGIRDLRLRGNNITHSGARDLAKLLSEDRCARQLRELDLSMNTITADGFRPLALSLRGCRELVRLDVGGCRLGPGGVEAAAELIAAAGPKLTTVILTPKAEFADRVLGDRGGLAVALRQSLQRLADSLRFAGTVVEVNLGAFLRGDPSAAASIEETLRENRERAGVVVGGERGGGGNVGGGEGGRRGDAGPGVASTPLSSRTTEKSRSGASKRGTPSSSSRTRGETAGVTPTTSSSGGSRRTPPTHRAGSAAAAGSTPARSTPSGSKDSTRHGVRGTGIERPKAGVERPKPGTAERTRRGGSARATPPPGPASAHRTSNKSSLKEDGGRGGVTPGRSSAASSAHKRGAGAASSLTTAATLAARDKAAAVEEAEAAAVAAAASASANVAPTPRRRMHQGEELDSIDGFSPTVAARVPPPPPAPSHGSSSSSRRPLPLSAAAGLGRTHTSRNTAPSPGGPLADGYPAGGIGHTAGPGAGTAATGSGAEGGRHLDSIADVVSKVMGDTEAMVAQESPLCVAPSTWQWQADAAAAAAEAREGVGGAGLYPQVIDDEAAGVRPPSPRAALAASQSLHSSEKPRPATSGAGAAVDGERGGRRPLVRKSSSSSVTSSREDKGERELADGMASLALPDERRPRSGSRETALEVSGGGGSSGQQMVTIAEAGRILGPLVAQEVEKETKKIEIRMQNEMNAALRSVRSEMEAIDREGLMARVAMEKRLKSGVKRLLDRIDHLERRFARVEREDRKRLALEAAPVAAIGASSSGSGGGVSGGGSNAGLLPYSSPPSAGSQARALPASAGATLPEEGRGRGRGVEGGAGVGVGGSGGRTKYVTGGGDGYGAAGPESRPLAVRERWGGEGRRDLSTAGGGGGGGVSGLSSAAVSDEEFEESGDEAEADIVRMLEEKMAALEGKLLGHEERQRADPHADVLGGGGGGGGDEAFGQGPAVWA